MNTAPEHSAKNMVTSGSAIGSLAHSLQPRATSESEAPGLPTELEDYGYGNGGEDSRMSTPPPPPSVSRTQPLRSEHEEQIEKNERRDEVEPGLTEFRNQRDLHVRQLKDLAKKATMVSSRIDILNDSVEQLRQQWGELERERAALLSSSERYEQKMIVQERIVGKDDVKAKKYHNYLTLAEEVLVLDDSDEDEDDDRPMFDWGTAGHGGVGDENGQ